MKLPMGMPINHWPQDWSSEPLTHQNCAKRCPVKVEKSFEQVFWVKMTSKINIKMASKLPQNFNFETPYWILLDCFHSDCLNRDCILEMMSLVMWCLKKENPHAILPYMAGDGVSQKKSLTPGSKNFLGPLASNLKISHWSNLRVLEYIVLLSVLRFCDTQA